MSSPLGLTREVAGRTATPSDLRTGIVSAVSSRGIDVSVAEGTVQTAAHLSSYNPAVGDPVAMISYANAWAVLGRLVGPGTATDYQTPGTGIGSTILDGCVLSGSGATMASSTGALVTVPRYGVTINHPAGHWVLLLATYTWFSTVVNDVVQVRIWEASGAVVGQYDHIQAGVATTSQAALVAALVPPTFGGAKRGYGLQVQRTAGSGTSRIDDHTVRRGSLIAYDLGDQSIIRTV